MAEQKENQFSGMTREQIILEAKKQILHSAVLALAALIVIGVACYAWFANNRVVTANLSSVSLNADCFELASVSDVGAFDNTTMPTDYTVPAGDEWTHEGKTGTITGSSHSIQWCVTEQSNLGNCGNDASGISPGAQNKLEFYVIPRRSGDMKLTCTLDIIPLPLLGDGNEDAVAEKLLRGHLLFDYQYLDQKGLIDIQDESFIINLANAVVGTPVKVTLNWRWPYVLEDAYKGDYGDEILGWIKDGNGAYSDFFFYTGDVDDTQGSETKPQVNITGKDPLKPAEYLELSEYYNNADQYIGNNVDHIIFRLTAEME